MNAQTDFLLFDSDNHYYEAEDAFTRHIEPGLARRAIQWAEIGGRKLLLTGGRVNHFIPNPTFNPVARPGCLDAYFRGRNPEGKGMRELFGELEPIAPAYRNPDARLALLDQQGIEACFLFPTLGVGMEEALSADPEAAMAAFRAFNRWLDEDWGFAYRERLFAAPYISLLDPVVARDELEWALERDVRVVVLRSAPVAHPQGPRSPADSRHDPFWQLANDSGILVAFHAGDAGYARYASDWGEGGNMKAFSYSPLRSLLSANPIQDCIAAMLAHRLFERFPNLRVATIESGSEWVSALVKKLRKTYGQMPQLFAEDPVQTLRRHCWIAPYYEDDLTGLRDLIGAERMLFGSDYPHAEGLAEPASFKQDLGDDFDAREIRLIMRDNGRSLIQRQSA